MNENIIIRELQKTDITKLVDFFSVVYHYKENDYLFLHKFYTWKYITNQEQHVNGTRSLIGTRDNKIVGFIGAVNYVLRDNYGLKNAAWITDWMVDKENAPQGLGKSLLSWLLLKNQDVLITCTEMSSAGSHVLRKFNYTSTNVGIHSYCFLTQRAVKDLLSRKGFRILFSILLQRLHLLLLYRNCLDFSEVKLIDLSLSPYQQQGLQVDKDYLKWIQDSPAFSGNFYHILEKEKIVGYMFTQPFTINGFKYIRILDYSIPKSLCFSFLQKVRIFYDKYDVINIKHHKQLKFTSIIAGFYNSNAVFFYPQQMQPNFDFSMFHVSNLEKDAAFRGVNNII